MEEQTAFEAMLRRYLAKLGARYAPVLAVLLALVLILILVPTTEPLSSAVNGIGPSPTPGGVSSGVSGSSGSQSGSGASGPAGGPGATPGSRGSSGPGGSSSSGSSSSSAGLNGAAPGTAPFAAGSAGGTSKTGVQCGPGVRQFSWSSHSPNCVAAFTGDNGGATAHGVTGSTITLTFRIPNSAQDQTIAALAGSANTNFPAMVQDFQAYIKYFNTQFELYGRHVVLKAYNGQGDYISEDQGQDLAGAQADAVSAHDMGAFGDVTFALGASEAYEQDLAAEHVISFSAAAEPQSWFERYAPYEYSVQGPSGTNGITAAAAVVCRRLAGMQAIFSGDDPSKPRVFGIIYPENPNYSQEEKQYEAEVASGCGLKIAKVVAYAINVSQYSQEAVSTVALMKAAHVTTVLCACDPIFPILLTPAASSQNYHPEWFTADFGDPVTQDYQADEWDHAAAGGTPIGDPHQTEAYKVYELANPGHQPAEIPPTSPPYYYVPYYVILHVFEALQAAGPNLTPYTFEQGEFSLPSSAVDPIGGQWVFGQNVFDPISSFGLVWWDPNATSSFDNKKGTWRACNGGQIYTLANLAALGGPMQQLHCFGK